MTEEQFEQLWQRAESRPYSDALMHEYPAWQHRRQVRGRLAMGMVALMLAVGVSLPLIAHQGSDDFEHVYCNRTGTADEQWVDLASELLLLS